MSAILKLISKKKTITFFWSKLTKLHKKDPVLHVTTTFSLKQGEIRTNSVPIPHPLILVEFSLTSLGRDSIMDRPTLYATHCLKTTFVLRN